MYIREQRVFRDPFGLSRCSDSCLEAILIRSLYRTRCAPTQDDVNDNATVSGYVPLYNPVPIYNESETSPPSTAPICVSYKVASDNAFGEIVDSGMAYTSSDVDYTLKVFHICLVTGDVRIDRIRSKPRISVLTLDIITSSVCAIPMSPAQSEERRPPRHLMTM